MCTAPMVLLRALRSRKRGNKALPIVGAVDKRDRIKTFVNPGADPLGSGYHVTQSMIAVGSGRIRGKGFLGGTQGSLQFLV